MFARFEKMIVVCLATQWAMRVKVFLHGFDSPLEPIDTSESCLFVALKNASSVFCCFSVPFSHALLNKTVNSLCRKLFS